MSGYTVFVLSIFSNQDKLRASKTDLRQWAIQRRKLQPDRIQISRSLCPKVLTLPEYHFAETVCSYVGVESSILPFVSKPGNIWELISV